MAGKRRAGASGALTEVIGILFMFGGFTAASIACYELAGIWLAIIPGCVALTWIGFNMATRRPSPGGTSTGTASGTRNGTGLRVEYVDPDEAVPPDTCKRYRDPGPGGTGTGT